MQAAAARQVVEELLTDNRLWLPALSLRRGFSSTRVEHLLNNLVHAMPEDEAYLEVGTLEGRTLEAAAHLNSTKRIIAFDHEVKYGAEPRNLPPNVDFRRMPWQDAEDLPPIGVAFYDGEHGEFETRGFAQSIQRFLAEDAILVFDDWDRQSVRRGLFPLWQQHEEGLGRLSLVAELPSYTDGLTMPPNHFGFYFGVSVWSYTR